MEWGWGASVTQIGCPFPEPFGLCRLKTPERKQQCPLGAWIAAKGPEAETGAEKLAARHLETGDTRAELPLQLKLLLDG